MILDIVVAVVFVVLYHYYVLLIVDHDNVDIVVDVVTKMDSFVQSMDSML
jgi:hypothetical protein